MKPLRYWTNISLLNLVVVALLGFLLRSKILFPLGALDYKNILNAHSHYAFGGWITLALCAAMAYRLTGSDAPRPVYHKALLALLLTAVGMVVSFPFQGYGAVSIFFSTAFIFSTYAFALFFIRDLWRSRVEPAVKTLSIGAVISLVLSSVGPYTLAWMLATKAANPLLYKDSIYTYLHLQYNGFFTLAVSALFLHSASRHMAARSRKWLRLYAWIAVAGVVPSLALSYLWHYTHVAVRATAFVGAALMVAQAVLALLLVFPLKNFLRAMQSTARILLTLSFGAYFLKNCLNAGILYEPLGTLVFGNRAVIIGFLHLVFLGFVSLFLLGYFVEEGLVPRTRTALAGIWIFTAGVAMNEVLLGAQGLGGMLSWSSHFFPWALWTAAITLLLGAAVLFSASVRGGSLPALTPSPSRRPQLT